jgi:hypothetical protein
MQQTWLGINNVRIEIAECLIVMGVIHIVEGHLKTENVWLHVNWSQALDFSFACHLTFDIDCRVGWLTEAALYLFTGRVRADEVCA